MEVFEEILAVLLDTSVDEANKEMEEDILVLVNTFHSERMT